MDKYFTSQIEIGKLHGVEVHGTTADTWRVEAHFAQIGLSRSVDMGSGTDKRVAYARVADALMSSGIERVLVYKNGKRCQMITVHTANQPLDGKTD